MGAARGARRSVLGRVVGVDVRRTGQDVPWSVGGELWRRSEELRENLMPAASERGSVVARRPPPLQGCAARRARGQQLQGVSLRKRGFVRDAAAPWATKRASTGRGAGAWRPPPPPRGEEGERASLGASRGGRRRTPNGGCERVEEPAGRRRASGGEQDEFGERPTCSRRVRSGPDTPGHSDPRCLGYQHWRRRRGSEGSVVVRRRVQKGLVARPLVVPPLGAGWSWDVAWCGCPQLLARPTGAQPGGGGANPRRRRRASGGGADPAGAPRRRDDRSFAA